MTNFYNTRDTYGKLSVFVFEGHEAKPIPNSKVIVKDMADNKLYEKYTDESGQTENMELATPPQELSLDYNFNGTPYGKYIIEVETSVGKNFRYVGAQVFDSISSVQKVKIDDNQSQGRNGNFEEMYVSENKLIGSDPPKEWENPFSPTLYKVSSPPPGVSYLIITKVPAFINIYLGYPYEHINPKKIIQISYKDYLKNVLCSEIYATWPKEAIKAMLLCASSFVLNRISTEFYKPRNFHISNSTRMDQKFNKGTTIHNSIGEIVDDLFTKHVGIKKSTVPFFTQYCDGRKRKCPNWATQWGMKDLAEQGMNYEEILKHFYGNEIYFEEAGIVEGFPEESYPGYELKEKIDDQSVKIIKAYLNRISGNYPAILKVKEDTLFDPQTTKNVKVFQRIFKLPQTGVIDRKTWYQINQIYTSVEGYAKGTHRSSKDLYDVYDYNNYYIPEYYQDMDWRIAWVPMWVPFLKNRR